MNKQMREELNLACENIKTQVRSSDKLMSNYSIKEKIAFSDSVALLILRQEENNISRLVGCLLLYVAAANDTVTKTKWRYNILTESHQLGLYRLMDSKAMLHIENNNLAVLNGCQVIE
jgi:hypothetical protein